MSEVWSLAVGIIRVMIKITRLQMEYKNVRKYISEEADKLVVKEIVDNVVTTILHHPQAE